LLTGAIKTPPFANRFAVVWPGTRPHFAANLLMHSIRTGQAMRQDLFEDVIDKGGFTPALPYRERKRQRTTLTLFASLALAFCTVVAVTVVSIGIAQAQMLVATKAGDGNLAIAFLVCSIVVGTIVGAIYRRRQQRPR
jgi:uncharacterized membrane protein (DUF485 family)